MLRRHDSPDRVEVQMVVTKSGAKLADVIKKAIEDSVITMAEYEEIFSVAGEDGAIDAHEQALLRELNTLIQDQIVAIKKAP
jgi:hypothetical protein